MRNKACLSLLGLVLLGAWAFGYGRVAASAVIRAVIYSLTRHSFLLLLAASAATALATEVVVQNYSGIPCQVDASSGTFLVPAGQSELTFAADVAGFTVSNTNGVAYTFDLTAQDQTIRDRFTVIVGTASASMSATGFSDGRAFAGGFGFGVLVFGFAWVLRIVRGIAQATGHNTGGEL